MPVIEKIGVTFATALRALLRQDPDVMLFGEIRDSETAEIATQAALTGHLVLSTLHTNDAPSALTRLLELGVAPYLVASTVHAVLAQRLVRTICQVCKRQVKVEESELPELAQLTNRFTHFARGAGCEACRGTGYHGRAGIYELLTMTDELRHAVTERRSSAELRHIMVGGGTTTLRDDGWRLVLAGQTTPEEVLRVTAS